ncbi:glutathione peroxidase [Bergeyella zoohelcum]|uniref:Glutathione peroxidase n=1 Tax=Bergeyella zoohelcum TaxID=1015 RepID=A0A7Z8YQ07_9FLAO|nr:glutathione peroxidase [Bergeyella zoohelcum]VDH04464.1 Glutathione peroxidase homolog BsaA [Bergeyella zoohelcum]
MKKIFLSFLAFGMVSIGTAQQSQKKKNSTVTQKQVAPASIHHFKIKALDGSVIDFSQFKGKKILIVNTASKCGYTPQYEQLEKLYQQYKNQLVIVGFPSDNFGGQELDTDKEIASFCKVNYGVTFPMATKVDVKGNQTIPIFKFLTQKSLNKVKDTEIKWNFTKFLLDEKGKLMDSFPSKVEPLSQEIQKYLK